jgi:hypothetical protein
MSDPVDALVLDLLESVSPERPYREVIEVWKTSCPRLPVWEEANERGYLEQHTEPGQPTMVRVTTKGREALNRARRGTGTA